MKSIYVFKSNNNLYKIGISKRVDERLMQVQIGSPHIEKIYESKRISNSYKIESVLHKQYNNNLIGREWFEFNDICSIIKNIEFLINQIGETNKTEPNTDKVGSLLLSISKKLEIETLELKMENKKIEEFLYCTLGIEQECDYTNIIYKTIFGKDASHLREYYGISKNDNVRDYFSEEDLRVVQNMEMLVSGLVGCGWGYEQIKDFIQNNQLKLAA